LKKARWTTFQTKMQMWWFEGALGLSIGPKPTKTRYGFFHIYPLNKPKLAHL